MQHQIHGGLPSTVLDLEVRTEGHQESNHLIAVQPHSIMQWGVSFSVLGIEISLAGDEVLSALVMTSPHRHMQRCAEKLVSGTDFGSFVQQQFQDICVSSTTCPVDGCGFKLFGKGKTQAR